MVRALWTSTIVGMTKNRWCLWTPGTPNIRPEWTILSPLTPASPSTSKITPSWWRNVSRKSNARLRGRWRTRCWSRWRQITRCGAPSTQRMRVTCSERPQRGRRRQSRLRRKDRNRWLTKMKRVSNLRMTAMTRCSKDGPVEYPRNERCYSNNNGACSNTHKIEKESETIQSF